MEMCHRRRSTVAGLAVIAAVLIMGTVGASAADSTSGDMTVWADYACYRVLDDPAVTEVEFFFAFQRHQFTFLPDDNGSAVNIAEIREVNRTNAAPVLYRGVAAQAAPFC